MGEVVRRGEAMIWNSFSDFLVMGGYAFYVWSSFGVCLLVLILEPYTIYVRRRMIVRQLQKIIRAEQYDTEELN